MKKKVLVLGGYITMIVILLIVNFLAGQALASPGTTRAQEEVDKPVPDHPDVPNASTFYCSSVNNVATFENRVHLRCSTSNGDIIYYAYATDPAHVATANQILAIANSAFALGKGVWVYYNISSDLNPPGCNSGDCRGLVGVSMLQ
jgi:hypothetical protein